MFKIILSNLGIIDHSLGAAILHSSCIWFDYLAVNLQFVLIYFINRHFYVKIRILCHVIYGKRYIDQHMLYTCSK